MRWTSQVASDLANKEKNLELVLEYLKSRGSEGAIDQEIQDALRMSGDSERPARGSLVKLGKVIDSGRWRCTRKNRPAIVWVAVVSDDDNENMEVPAC